jgi:hypothetical protein
MKFLIGKGRYADVKPPGTLYLAILRSHRAHARITGVDLSVTMAAAGVRLALGGADLAGRIGARARQRPPRLGTEAGSKRLALLTGDRWFESCSLQQRVTQNLRASPAGAGSRPTLSGDRSNGPRGRAGETQAPVHSKPALRSPSKRWSTSPGSAQFRRNTLAEDSRFASISLSSASAARASSILPSWPSPATT